jgi:hypothetical protein
VAAADRDAELGFISSAARAILDRAILDRAILDETFLSCFADAG